MLTYKQFYDKYLFGDRDLLSRMERGMEVDEVVNFLISKITPEEISDSKRTKLVASIVYDGEYPRRFLRAGYELIWNAPRTRAYTTVDGKKFWTLKAGGPSIGSLERRESFPAAVHLHFKKKGTKCALSGAAIDGLPEIDHRVPILRIKIETKLDKDISSKEIDEKFMGVSKNANMKKKEICSKCKRTETRPGGTYKASIPFWFDGNEKFIETNKPGGGCYGCYWNNPEQWDLDLAAKVK